MTRHTKSTRGRPIKNPIKKIDAPAEDIVQALFAAADINLEKKRSEINKE